MTRPTRQPADQGPQYLACPSWTLTSHSMLSSLSEAREGIRRHRENGLYLNPNTQKIFNAAKVSIQVIIASAKDLIDRASAG